MALMDSIATRTTSPFLVPFIGSNTSTSTFNHSNVTPSHPGYVKLVAMPEGFEDFTRPAKTSVESATSVLNSMTLIIRAKAVTATENTRIINMPRDFTASSHKYDQQISVSACSQETLRSYRYHMLDETVRQLLARVTVFQH